MTRRRVLALRQDNNGDVLLAGPALRALARDASVTLVCGPGGAAAAHLLPGIECVLVARADWIEAKPRPIARAYLDRFVATIRSLEFDDAFVFTSFHQSPLPAALLLKFAGVGAVHAISVDYPGSLLDTRVQVPDDIHEVERALALVDACGFRLPAGDDGSLQMRALPPVRRALPRPYVAIQPGATVAARAWAPEKHRALAAHLRTLGHHVVVLGSPSERELTSFVAGDSAVDLGGKTSFAEFASIVAEAQALVVANTSGIHVASALGTPVVSIFPPTIPPVRFAPWRVPHVMLGDHGIACRSCRARTCPVPNQPCIGNVTIDAVSAALRELFAGAKAA
jgi:ADP-heptose:LPS heptosyltransferase